MNKELILQEARDWLSSYQEGNNIYENEKFLSWLNSSIEHKKIFEEEKEFRKRIFSLSSEQKVKLSKKTKQEFKRERIFKNIRISSFLAACLLLLTLTYLFKDSQKVYSKQFHTKKEIKKIQLPDNSKITLDAKTNINIAYFEQKREVILNKGKALFEISSNKNRPFLVKNDSILVQVIGTKFEVSREKNKVKVSVLEGIVAIRYGENERARLLARLEKSDSLDISSLGKINSLQKIELNKMATWSNKKLFFNQTPLDEVIKEFSKYTDIKVQSDIKNPKDFPISAQFGLYDLDKFLEYLPLIYPIKIEKTKTNKVILKEL